MISSEEILNKLSSIYYESYHLKRKVTRLNKEISDIKYKLSKYESKDMNTYHDNINTNEFHDSDNDVIKDIDIMFSDPHKKIGEMDEYNEYNEIKIHNDSDDDLNGNIITQNMLENADKIISDMLYQYHKSERIIIESCYATKTGFKKGKKGNNQDSYFIFEDLIPTNNQQNIVQFYGVLVCFWNYFFRNIISIQNICFYIPIFRTVMGRLDIKYLNTALNIYQKYWYLMKK